MADAPATLMNDPASRTPDGTIKDQGASTQQQTDSSSTTQQQTNPQETTPPKDNSTTTTKDDKTLLTKDGEKKDDAAQQGAPEKYADFKAPDGITLDKDLIAKALPIFKELNLTQDAAQKLIDFQIEASKAAAEGPLKAYADMRADWKKDAVDRFGKDIEPGGRMITSISKMIDSHLPPTLAKSFRAAMDFTGVGDNPDFSEGIYVLSRLLAEGTSVTGKGPSPEGQKAPGTPPPSIAQAIYPNLPSSNTAR